MFGTGTVRDRPNSVPLVFTGNPQSDLERLTGYVSSYNKDLDGLGPKRARRDSAAAIADKIHRTLRTARHQFMTHHAEWVYSTLATRQSPYRNILDFALEAGVQFPGLVPTSEQYGRERILKQEDKEGHEIDQGIFFHHLLGNRATGPRLLSMLSLPTERARALLPAFETAGVADLGSVHVHRLNNTAFITIYNPDCLNAEDDNLVEDLETAVDLALMDDKVSIGLLRGGVVSHPKYFGERIFSAGINLKALYSGQISYANFVLRRELGFLNKIYRGLNLSPPSPSVSQFERAHIEKPWIAVVDNFAIGGGFQLLPIFDRVIACSNSYFSLPAAQEGIVPGFANMRLQRHFGTTRTRHLVLTGHKLFATDPAALMLIDEVVSPRALDEAIARNIELLGHPAITANRHMLNWAQEPLDSFLSYASEFALAQVDRLYSNDVLARCREFSHRKAAHL